MSSNDTVNPSNFAAALLSAVGKPSNVANDPNWQGAVNAWVASEGGFAASSSFGASVNNPLNANCNWSGQIGCTHASFGDVGHYATLSDAVQSYAAGLSAHSSSAVSYGYTNIVNSASPTAFVQNVINSSWAGGHYKTDMGAWNAFLATQGAGGITSPNDPQPSPGSNEVPQANPISLPGVGIGGAAGDIFTAIFDPNKSFVDNAISALGGSIGEAFINIIAILLGVAMILFSLYALVKGTPVGDAVKLIPIPGPAEGQLASNVASSASKRTYPQAAPSRRYAGGSQATGPTPTVNVNAVASNSTETVRGELATPREGRRVLRKDPTRSLRVREALG